MKFFESMVSAFVVPGAPTQTVTQDTRGHREQVPIEMLDRCAALMLLDPDEDFLNEVIHLGGGDALRKIPPQSRQIAVESACWLACSEDGHDANMTRLAG